MFFGIQIVSIPAIPFCFYQKTRFISLSSCELSLAIIYVNLPYFQLNILMHMIYKNQTELKNAINYDMFVSLANTANTTVI